MKKKTNKKAKGRAPGRRRGPVKGVGAIDFGSVAVTVLCTMGGAVLPEVALAKFAPTMDPKVTGGIQALAGGLLLASLPGNQFLGGVGSGMIAGGSIRFMKAVAPGLFGAEATAPVNGIGEFREQALVVDTDFDDDTVSGLGNPDFEGAEKTAGGGPNVS